MAAVWAGLDMRLDRPVAVKILDGPTDPTMVRRLEQEARTLASLAHPAIVAAYDTGAEDGVPYLVMEFVEGQNLGQRLQDGPLPFDAAAWIAAQVCDALQAAHAAGVVHRDIKPENILLTSAGAVKVCDFGIARLLRADRAGLTGQAIALGTSAYMAPEQATAGEVDARSDLYALGCVLYQMLTGRPPFTGDDPMRIVWQHAHELPTPVAELTPGVPADLNTLVTQLLAKDPGRRPATAGAVRDRLIGLSGAAAAFGPLAVADSGAAASSSRAATSSAQAPVPTQSFRAVNPTRMMPAAQDRPARHAPGGFRVGPLGIAGVAAGAAAVTALVVGLAMAPEQQQGTTGPDLSTSAVPADASPSVTRPSAGTVDAVRAAVAAALQSGELDRQAAGDLDRRLDQIERDLRRGDRRNAAQRIDDLSERLDRLRRDDRLSDSAYATIAASLDALASTLPSDGDEDDD